jgi:hypothetical protein
VYALMDPASLRRTVTCLPLSITTACSIFRITLDILFPPFTRSTRPYRMPEISIGSREQGFCFSESVQVLKRYQTHARIA